MSTAKPSIPIDHDADDIIDIASELARYANAVMQPAPPVPFNDPEYEANTRKSRRLNFALRTLAALRLLLKPYELSVLVYRDTDAPTMSNGILATPGVVWDPGMFGGDEYCVACQRQPEPAQE